jgi:tRNA (adenine37-N6)-methyltransferase
VDRLRVIGTLSSCFREKFGAPRQPQVVPSATASLTLAKDLIAEHSLDGLAEFSHVWLISYLHLNANKTFRPKVHPPRLKGKTVGLFASRSPHRPSALGLTLARLDRVEGATLFFSGIDLVEGTPILDIKPYIPAYDAAPRARAGWVAKMKEVSFKVLFARAADLDLKKLGLRGAKLRKLIQEVLKPDLRNPRDASQQKSGKVLELFLHDRRVEFAVEGRKAVVRRVLPAGPWEKSRGRSLSAAPGS